MKERLDDVLNKKQRKYKILKISSLFLAIFFTLFGSVSIVSFLYFLNEMFKLTVFECFVYDLLLGSVYSFIANEILKKVFDDRIKKEVIEINRIENEIKQNENDKTIENIEYRFNNLSKNNQLKLLNSMKKDFVLVFEEEEKLCNFNIEVKNEEKYLDGVSDEKIKIRKM